MMYLKNMPPSYSSGGDFGATLAKSTFTFAVGVILLLTTLLPIAMQSQNFPDISSCLRFNMATAPSRRH